MPDAPFDEFFREHRRQIESVYQASGAGQWSVSLEDFARAVWEGAKPEVRADRRETVQLLANLRARDLGLALGCSQGNERAWDAFCAEYRSVLYDAARAFLADDARARELADSLLGELYGLDASSGTGTPACAVSRTAKSGCATVRSRFAYFHGRSSLKTWLRAVLYQRFVDEYRRERRLEPLDEGTAEPAARERAVAEADDRRYGECLSEAVEAALAELRPPEKLLLSYYYVQELTLKQIGRLTGEHEATISRRLEALRKRLRKRIEGYLRRVRKLSAFEVDRCLDFATRGVGVDLGKALRTE